MRWRAFLPAAVIALICLLPGVGQAEEKRDFVDSEGSTGYYVYMDSVVWEETMSLYAEIAAVKAGNNRLYRYQIRFYPENQTYQVLSSKTFAYDTKQELEAVNTPQAVRFYSPTSIMQEIIDYIRNPK